VQDSVSIGKVLSASRKGVAMGVFSAAAEGVAVATMIAAVRVTAMVPCAAVGMPLLIAGGLTACQVSGAPSTRPRPIIAFTHFLSLQFQGVLGG
jgi:hypothetical protein